MFLEINFANVGSNCKNNINLCFNFDPNFIKLFSMSGWAPYIYSSTLPNSWQDSGFWNFFEELGSWSFLKIKWGQWGECIAEQHSRIAFYPQNRKIPGSNHANVLGWALDTTSFQGFQWPLGQTRKHTVINTTWMTLPLCTSQKLSLRQPKKHIKQYKNPSAYCHIWVKIGNAGIYYKI